MSSNENYLLNHAKAVRDLSDQLPIKREHLLFRSAYGLETPISTRDDCKRLVAQLLETAQNYAFFLERDQSERLKEQAKIYNQLYSNWLSLQQHYTGLEASVVNSTVDRTKAEIEQREEARASLGWFGSLLDLFRPL